MKTDIPTHLDKKAYDVIRSLLYFRVFASTENMKERFSQSWCLCLQSQIFKIHICTIVNI